MEPADPLSAPLFENELHNWVRIEVMMMIDLLPLGTFYAAVLFSLTWLDPCHEEMLTLREGLLDHLIKICGWDRINLRQFECVYSYTVIPDQVNRLLRHYFYN
jgi:hypothetical protein